MPRESETSPGRHRGPLPHHPAARALDGGDSDPGHQAVRRDGSTGTVMPPRPTVEGCSPGRRFWLSSQPLTSGAHAPPPRWKGKMGSDIGTLCTVSSTCRVLSGQPGGSPGLLCHRSPSLSLGAKADVRGGVGPPRKEKVPGVAAPSSALACPCSPHPATGPVSPATPTRPLRGLPVGRPPVSCWVPSHRPSHRPSGSGLPGHGVTLQVTEGPAGARTVTASRSL